MRYTDPSGHINNDPAELARAADILNRLSNDYDVHIAMDWGWVVHQHVWNPGSWDLVELETVLTGVSNLASLMGNAQQFRNNLGTIDIGRKPMNAVGQAEKGQVWLRSKARGGFMGRWQGTWTVVHELAHAWDRANEGSLSRDLETYTGGRTYSAFFGCHFYCPDETVYDYGGTPPKGADSNFTRKEDFAESVATFVYPDVAKDFIAQHFSGQQLQQFSYSNYYHLPRARFVAGKMNVDARTYLRLEGSQ